MSKQKVQLDGKLLNRIVDAMPGGVGIYNVFPDLRFEQVYLNDGYYRIIGKTREERSEYSGFSAIDAVCEADKAGVTKEVLSAIKENRIANYDVRVIVDEGKYKWLNFRASIAEKTEEKCIIYATYSDIDQIKKLQEESQNRYESELRLRRELNRESMIFYQVNLTTRIIEECQSRYHEIVPIKCPCVATMDFWKQVFPNIVEKYNESVTSTFSINSMIRDYHKGKNNVTLTYQRILLDGCVHWVKTTATIVKKPISDELFAFVSVQDIDEETKDRMVLNRIIDREIESVIILRIRDKKIRIVMEDHELGGYGSGNSFYPSEKFREDLLYQVIDSDLEMCKSCVNLQNVTKFLEKQEKIKFTYRIQKEDGSLHRKMAKIFYLDETKEDLVYVRQDITDV